ncbi:DUF3141 domain-containing protein [Comamonas testosteroni]|uniref:DUF3141 domain-containing protein n=1 Tax=Comamonas testosteroni TaxID=285 RepID=UPI002DB6579F|nr:DUF3141 domain-containing protein [Comamonas testosteroni]MEB5964371.1 DUF3141 domain-containing protein [Comamonas testosteroni]
MSKPSKAGPSAQGAVDPLAGWRSAAAYALDAAQRAVLYADIERRVGDQYRIQRDARTPNVLHFPAELVMSGLELPRPVNYGLVRIQAPENRPAEPGKRPFVVIDPRAGHGPGIGGFKPYSEIGAALEAGHPCYFVGFLPDPVPGQTVEDVMRAEAAFMRRVAELHPESEGKPAVIGNCQAGWQILMTAAVWPELFGPIIVAGAPLSYWAGDNPMRYSGGLLGGSWLTALSSDLGNGRFDGAHLVQNFEQLDPANTLWSKQYRVYANADTEAERYIGFEKYWGGYVFLNDVEMQYIVDNLFIGNKLSTARLLTSDGVRIDLRNIRSPILVFCSYGDNITPPAQALGWITDLYASDDDVRAHDQTIIFSTHDSIGHLGIFVSGAVGSKQHRKFASAIEQINLLPAGLYRASVDDATAQEQELLHDPYLLSIRASGLDEVRDIVKPDAQAERRFDAAARVSDINLALYRSLWQPWVRAFSTSESARWLQTLHPMRLQFEAWSSQHPLAALIRGSAEYIREHRQPVDEANPWLQMQQQGSAALERSLDDFRDRRDHIYALWFDMLYGSPLMQALAGHAYGESGPVRQHPGTTPEHLALMADRQRQIEDSVDQGGVLEATLRGLLSVLSLRRAVDERYYHLAAQLLEQEAPGRWSLAELRTAIREQTQVMRQCGSAALDAIPGLLKSTPAETIRKASQAIASMAAIDTGAKAEQQAVKGALQRVQALFEQAALAQQAPMDEAQVPHLAPARASATATRPKPAARRQPAASRGKKGVR